MQTNRSFLYGESVFTTAMLYQGRILFLRDHLDRLLKGANFLWGPFSVNDFTYLREKIEKSLPANLANDGLRITLSYSDQERVLLRDGFEVEEIQVDFLSFNKGMKKPLRLKSIKTANQQNLLPDYLKNSRRTQETLTYFKSGFITHAESLLFCGPAEEVFETSWANIFACQGNTLYTPKTGGSVLAGIMRNKVLALKDHPFSDIREENFDLSWLKNCDFVFATNALWGVLPIEKIDTTNLNQPIDDFFKFEKVIFDEETNS